MVVSLRRRTESLNEIEKIFYVNLVVRRPIGDCAALLYAYKSAF